MFVPVERNTRTEKHNNMKASKESARACNINTRINANANLEGVYQIAQELKKRAGVNAKAFIESHSEVYIDRYAKRWVMASKRMRRERGLIGAGRYLREERQ